MLTVNAECINYEAIRYWRTRKQYKLFKWVNYIQNRSRKRARTVLLFQYNVHLSNGSAGIIERAILKKSQHQAIVEEHIQRPPKY